MLSRWRHLLAAHEAPAKQSEELDTSSPVTPIDRLSAQAVTHHEMAKTGRNGYDIRQLESEHRRERASRRLGEAELALRQAAALLSGAPIPASLDEPHVLGRRHRRGYSPPGLIGLPAPDSVARIAQARETLLAALHSLSNNRLRSLLTAVGIVIGVAAVIILVALGNGMKANFNAQFSKLANQITVTPASGSVPDGGVARALTDQDVAALQDAQRAPDIGSVSPSMTGTVSLTEGQATDRASMVGATVNYLDLLDRTVVAGSWFTPAQVSAKERVAVVGQQAVALLWGSTADLGQVVGSQIRVNHTTFKIAGVLDSNGQNDNVVIVPFGTSRTYLVGDAAGAVSQIIVKSTSVDAVNQAASELTDILDQRHYVKNPADRDFNVATFTDLLAKSTQFVNFLTLFIVAIAAISLIVGGIGVANIMLVSVTERTREIGIRKAVGATRRAILRQFLSEAVMLTGLGGLVGVILGVSTAAAGQEFLPKVVSEFPAPVLTPAPILIAFAVSLAIGVLAGGYPANRAARMRPIEALRFE
jgi:putative ABC transport system permease protein